MLPAARRVVARVAEVVLDVAVARRLAREQAALELGEDHLVGLAQHVREHVQPAAVRHAEDDLLDAQVAAVLDQRRASIGMSDSPPSSEKRFAVGYLRVQELLEALGRDELVEDAHAVLVG